MTTQEQSATARQLGDLLRDVARRQILGRFQKLEAGDVMGKPTPEDPTDLVTAADRAAEAELTDLLPRLVPGSSVVGEEAVAADAGLLGRLRADAPVWVVDPLDGTRNFAAGHGPFGTMVALAEQGRLLLTGIYLPLEDAVFVAERGAGAFRNGSRILPRTTAPGVLSGTAYVRYMPEAPAAELLRRAAAHRQLPDVMCAAEEYTRIAMGAKDYVHYYRLLPWDHAPGALIVREAGGVVRHPDGRDYDLLDGAQSTLLAPDEPTWRRAQSELFG